MPTSVGGTGKFPGVVELVNMFLSDPGPAERTAHCEFEADPNPGRLRSR
jgi:hypothetical protein